MNTKPEKKAKTDFQKKIFKSMIMQILEKP